MDFPKHKSVNTFRTRFRKSNDLYRVNEIKMDSIPENNSLNIGTLK
jgi:hypothetical protein